MDATVLLYMLCNSFTMYMVDASDLKQPLPDPSLGHCMAQVPAEHYVRKGSLTTVRAQRHLGWLASPSLSVIRISRRYPLISGR